MGDGTANAINTYNLIIMRTFFQGIPIEIEESGRIDGLSDFRLLSSIIVPLSKPVLHDSWSLLC